VSAAGGPTRISAEQLSLPAGSGWARLPLVGLVIGIIGVAATFALGAADPHRMAFAWLVAFLYFLSIALGGLFFVLAHHATKAGWGVAVRRLAENVMATLPLFVLLFVPVWLWIDRLFEWSDPAKVAEDHLLQGKAAFLNPGFFTARAVIYLAIWCALALWYASRSRRQDESGDEALTRRMIFWAGPAIAVFAVSTTLASFDWGMSLSPHWYSTIYGVYFFAGSLVGVFALLVLLAVALSRGPLEHVITLEHFHDLGKLLFAFCVFWAYIGFSQFFLIWYGNIPEETEFFLRRFEGGWLSLSVLLALGHFAVPFLFLMPRTIKRRTGLLALGAAWMLLMHLLDIYWLVMPNLQDHARPSLIDLAALVGVGGLFAAVLGWNLRRGALVPVRDPRLAESLSFENV